MKYSLEIITFLSGAVVMIIELVGSRLIAPYLGTSIFVWTSLIGIILASLSLGYVIGGKRADKDPSYSGLSSLFFWGTIFSIWIIISEPILAVFATASIDIRLSTVLATCILFLPVTFTLGMVTPYVTRLKLTAVEKAGNTIGTLYALSTLGSIIGTFLGGFILISLIGTKAIFFSISCILFLLFIFSVFLAKRHNSSLFKIIALLFLLVIEFVFIHSHVSGYKTSLADIDTPYNRWLIYDSVDSQTQRKTRLLVNNNYGLQSGIYVDAPSELLFDYLKIFDIAYSLVPGAKETLLIGAGAYTYPNHFLASTTGVHMDVVEIDTALDDIAKQYFSYTKNPRIRAYEEDGRIFLNSTGKKYDVIFLDAFSSKLSIPYHLTTIETVEKIAASLSRDGIVMSNIISGLEGTTASFLQAQYATYKTIFPHVVALQVNTAVPKEAAQNIILIASHSQLDILKKLSHAIPEDDLDSDGAIHLTDDFAPIERMSEELI